MSWDMWRGRPFFTLSLFWGLTMNSGENSWKVLRLCVAPFFLLVLIYVSVKIFLIYQILLSTDIIQRPVSFQCCCLVVCGSHPALWRAGEECTLCIVSILPVRELLRWSIFLHFCVWAGLWHPQGNNHQKFQGWAVATGVRFNEDPHTRLS